MPEFASLTFKNILSFVKLQNKFLLLLINICYNGNMSRSYRKPYCKDSRRCNKYWKRLAQKAFRKHPDPHGNMWYKRIYCSWVWCDYSWYYPQDKKFYRK